MFRFFWIRQNNNGIAELEMKPEDHEVVKKRYSAFFDKSIDQSNLFDHGGHSSHFKNKSS